MFTVRSTYKHPGHEQVASEGRKTGENVKLHVKGILGGWGDAKHME